MINACLSGLADWPQRNWYVRHLAIITGTTLKVFGLCRILFMLTYIYTNLAAVYRVRITTGYCKRKYCSWYCDCITCSTWTSCLRRDWAGRGYRSWITTVIFRSGTRNRSWPINWSPGNWYSTRRRTRACVGSCTSTPAACNLNGRTWWRDSGCSGRGWGRRWWGWGRGCG